MTIKQKCHLIIVGIIFLIYSLIILTDTYNYYIERQFNEGFIIVFKIILFDFVEILALIPFLIKKRLQKFRCNWWFVFINNNNWIYRFFNLSSFIDNTKYDRNNYNNKKDIYL